MHLSPKHLPPLTSKSDRGVALILVTLLIALASVLVVNLTYSTTLGSRESANLQRSTQAEYLLKSAVNTARVLIREDKTSEDSTKDIWGKFLNGITIPSSLLSIEDKNVRLSLEIRPEDSKMPLSALVPPGASLPDKKWVEAFTLLFRQSILNFDNDKEIDQTGYYPDRHFNSQDLVGILIDYMDPDKDSYSPGGIEGDGVIPDTLFPNQPVKRLSELSAIPGFSPARVRKLLPLVSAVGNIGGATMRVNINLAPSIVIQSLNPKIDQAMVSAIVAFRSSDEGPFTQSNYINKLIEITGDSELVRDIQSMITVESKWFQIIAKVDYGTSLYFIRAYISKGRSNELPEIHSVELF